MATTGRSTLGLFPRALRPRWRHSSRGFSTRAPGPSTTAMVRGARSAPATSVSCSRGCAAAATRSLETTRALSKRGRSRMFSWAAIPSSIERRSWRCATAWRRSSGPTIACAPTPRSAGRSSRSPTRSSSSGLARMDPSIPSPAPQASRATRCRKSPAAWRCSPSCMCFATDAPSRTP